MVNYTRTITTLLFIYACFEAILIQTREVKNHCFPLALLSDVEQSIQYSKARETSIIVNILQAEKKILKPTEMLSPSQAQIPFLQELMTPKAEHFCTLWGRAQCQGCDGLRVGTPELRAWLVSGRESDLGLKCVWNLDAWKYI
ncbi:mitogen-activated protein kinase 1 [Platysternon megacephalum]|uniref:Mitogen-activated protein kinase 1 n=1 Tax=Platysternon megacephalum TaxID=55544 RepID=A0A4D9F3A5_9SAUR|nr:mitogen-activated protein kinase 1 [Platysternon megacephalum]